MHNPTNHNWQALKCVFRYIKGTHHLGLLYRADTSLVMHGFIDSDWAGCLDTWRSHSGNCFMLGSSCIFWFNKEEAIVTTYSCEAEYRVVFTATIECVWLRKLLVDLLVS